MDWSALVEHFAGIPSEKRGYGKIPGVIEDARRKLQRIFAGRVKLCPYCKATTAADSLREWQKEKQRQKQIPFGNDNQEGKGNSRFPAGMTTKKAKATADSPEGE